MTDTKLKPGRELAALVAEKVMGLKVLGVQLYQSDIDYRSKDLLHETRGYREVVPYYSTDIAAAWEVVEMISGGRHVVLEKFCGHWRCDLSVLSAAVVSGSRALAQGRAETAPHAICLAALKAVKA